MFFDIFKLLCEKKGVSPKKATEDIGLSTSITTKWKNTGATPKGDTLQRIADYFGVTTDYLLTGEETKKAPTQDGERGIDEQNLKVAFFRGADPTLTDEEIDDMWDDAKDLRDLLIMKKRRERDGK